MFLKDIAHMSGIHIVSVYTRVCVCVCVCVYVCDPLTPLPLTERPTRLSRDGHQATDL